MLLRYIFSILLGLWLAMPSATGQERSDTVWTYSVEAGLEDPLSVTHLWLRRKDWKTLPPGVHQFRNLEVIDLGWNRNLNLENTFPILSQLPKLRVLSLRMGKHVVLPDNISGLSQLEELDLGSNRLIRLPVTFHKLKKLKWVNLYHNTHFDIGLVLIELSRLSNLEWLCLRACKLYTLIPAVGKMKKLRYLDLGKNKVLELPEEMGKMKSLRTLILSSNYGGQIKGKGFHIRQDRRKVEYETIDQAQVFGVLAGMNRLEVLELRDCKISKLHKDIGALTNVRELYLQGNLLRHLPDQIGQMRSLEVLSVRNPVSGGHRTNIISSLPASIGRLKKLRILDLTANEFLKVDSDIGQLKKLEELHMSWNRLAKIPKQLQGLRYLRVLDLSINLINEMPEWIGELSSLEELHLDADFFRRPEFKIRDLPPGILELENLRILRLNDQLVEFLPEGISRWKKLEELHLRGNLLQQIPAEIAGLPRLRQLDVKGNELSDLPVEIIKLAPTLEALNIAFNPVLNVSREWPKLAALNNLSVLDISYTEPVSEEQLRDWRKKMPNCDIRYAEVRR